MSLREYVEVEITPVAAVRPKVTRWNTYYPGEYGSYLPKLKELLKKAYQGSVIRTECRLRVECIMPRPKSHFRTGRNSHLVKNGAPLFPHQDVDNLLKGAMDAASGVLYEDDRLVVEVACRKAYGAPRISYEVNVLSDD
jgi:Holliday junction resolvase RusA-like endonuclease